MNCLVIRIVYMKKEILNIYPWFLINEEARAIKDKILNGWIGKINDTNLIESDYQSYLKNHAGFFLADNQYSNIVISKMKLGSDWETDFVVATDWKSMGLRYNIIEIKTPHSKPFNKNGDPSADLTHAYQQIVNWKLWFESNTQATQRLFPTPYTSYPTYFEYTIYIGNRENTKQYLKIRNKYAEINQINVRTFDSLTDNFHKRTRFLDIVYSDGSTEAKDISYEIKNKLANPFFKAYTDKTWRKIVNSPDFIDDHILIKNSKIFLDNREYNSYLKDFDLIWNNLPNERKEKIYELIEKCYKL